MRGKRRRRLEHEGFATPAAGARRSLGAAGALLLAASGGAAYLTSLSSGLTRGCGAGEGCEEVLASRWAYWFGAPVSAPGLAAYLVLATAILLLGWRRSSRVQALWVFASSCSWAIVLVALWFVLLQILALGSFCPFCLMTHASAVLAALLILRAHEASVPRERAALHRRRAALSAGGAAAGALALLIGGQLLGAPPRPTAAQTRMTAAADVARSRPEISLHGGRFTLDARELPVRGAANAPLLMVSLFDYTCSHCRQTHRMIRELERKYGDGLGVISLPTPLDASCNPLVQETLPAHAHACDYARLALAVFRARAAAFVEFDEWVFSGQAAPPIEEVRAKARALVGAEALASALRGGWVETQLERNISLYRANSEQAGNGRMPQIVIGGLMLNGVPGGAEELARALEQQRPRTPLPG